MKLHFFLVLGVLISLGCGGASRDAAGPQAMYKHRAAAEAGQANKPNPNPDQAGGEVKEQVSRKIIYSADVELVVEDFDQAEKSLLKLVEEHKGYVAKSDAGGPSGGRRSGNWTVRIPVAGFRAFLDSLNTLGEQVKSSTDSQDVTDEFYDLEARIKNKKVEEDRLIEHLKKSTGRLEEILTVERELSRVRGEIEVAQGRLNKLSKLADLSTVTIHLHQRKDYVPVAAPSFGTSLGRTFEGSLDLLLSVGKGIVLVLTALVPWLPVLAVIGVAIWLLVRRLTSSRNNQSPPLEVVPVEPAPPG